MIVVRNLHFLKLPHPPAAHWVRDGVVLWAVVQIECYGRPFLLRRMHFFTFGEFSPFLHNRIGSPFAMAFPVGGHKSADVWIDCVNIVLHRDGSVVTNAIIIVTLVFWRLRVVGHVRQPPRFAQFPQTFLFLPPPLWSQQISKHVEKKENRNYIQGREINLQEINNKWKVKSGNKPWWKPYVEKLKILRKNNFLCALHHSLYCTPRLLRPVQPVVYATTLFFLQGLSVSVT